MKLLFENWRKFLQEEDSPKQLIKEQVAAKSHRVKGKQGYYQILRDMGLLKGLKKNEMRAQIQKLKKAFQGQVITTKDVVSVDAAGNFTVVGPRQPKKAAAPKKGPPGRLIKPGETTPETTEAKPEVKVKPDPNVAYNKLKQRRDVQGAKPGEPGAKKTEKPAAEAADKRIKRIAKHWLRLYNKKDESGKKSWIELVQKNLPTMVDHQRAAAQQFLKAVEGGTRKTTKVDKPGVQATTSTETETTPTTRTETKTTSGTVSRANLPEDQQEAYIKFEMALNKKARRANPKRRPMYFKRYFRNYLTMALTKNWNPKEGIKGLKKCCPGIYKLFVAKTQ